VEETEGREGGRKYIYRVIQSSSTILKEVVWKIISSGKCK
jgi:hypothetical protein